MNVCIVRPSLGSFIAAALLALIASLMSVPALHAQERPAVEVHQGAQGGETPATSTTLKPWRPDALEPSGTPFLMFKGLGVCLAVLLIGAWIVKKTGLAKPRTGSGRIKILERCPLSTKSSIVLLEIEGKSILVAVGPEQVTLLSEGGKDSRFEQSLEDECARELQHSA